MTVIRERRLHAGDVEYRAKQGGAGGLLVGYAAVFNRYSQNLGGFVEQVAPGAFAKTIAEADIRGLFNHDANLVLGRTSSATMRLAEDNIGLHFEIDLPDTAIGRDVATLVERDDVTGSSFSFRVMPGGVEWGYTQQDFPLRTLTEVQLYDVGPVTFPAYLDSEAELARSALTGLAESRDLNLDELVAAAGRNELRSFLKGDQSSAPEQHSTPDLTIARRQLEHAARRWPRSAA